MVVLLLFDPSFPIPRAFRCWVRFGWTALYSQWLRIQMTRSPKLPRFSDNFASVCTAGPPAVVKTRAVAHPHL